MEKLTKRSQLVVQVHFLDSENMQIKRDLSFLDSENMQIKRDLSFKRYVPFLRVVAK